MSANSSQNSNVDLDEKIYDRITKITKTPGPDSLEFDVNSLIDVVESIFRKFLYWPYRSEEKPKSLESNFEKSLSDIEQISCELTKRVSQLSIKKTDPDEAVLSVLESMTLKTYDWDDTLVLTMAAFGLTCGRVWLTSELTSGLYFSKKIGRPLAMLRKISGQAQGRVSREGMLRERFSSLRPLMLEMMELSRIVVKFSNIEYEYISPKYPAFSEATARRIPVATYWIIKSALSSLTMIANGDDKNEIKSMEEKLADQYRHLHVKWSECEKITAKNKEYETLLKLLNTFDTNEGGIGPVLKALFTCAENELPTLYDGWRKREVSINEVVTKQFMLLISNLDIEQNELQFLQKIYRREWWYRATSDVYEIVWIPMKGDKKESVQKSNDLRMIWCSCDPTSLTKPAIKMIKEVWHFRNSPMLVVLDAKGTIVCPNAIPMMFIWGNKAHPFTTIREQLLWEDEKWTPQLLLRGNDDREIFNKIEDNEDNYIFLYGGYNVDKWTNEFQTLASEIARKRSISLKMVNVCRNNEDQSERETEENIIYKPESEKLWLFWRRIESMMYSKILGKYKYDDEVLREIMKTFAYYKEGGWVLLCKGSKVLVNGQSKIVLRTLKEHDQWKDKEFDEGFRQYYDKNKKIKDGSDHLCCQLNFPDNLGSRIPRRMICPDCNRIMNRHVTFVYSDKDEIIELPL